MLFRSSKRNSPRIDNLLQIHIDCDGHGDAKFFQLNTQKILLTTDGSITAILDVLYGKITLKTLDQHFEDADENHARLVNVGEGEEINFREVIMHRNGNPLIYAISHIPLKRCSKEVCADLIRADIPIGRILKNYHIESRREVNNIFIEKPNETLG